MLPEFNSDGDLPVGVHLASWQEFQSRFGTGTPRRLWLFGRFQALVELAASTGKLRRVFIWGSFVTAKPVPRDVDTLPIMDEDFEVERVPVAARVSSSIRFTRSCCSNRMFFGRELPSERRSCNCGWIPIRLPGTLENAVL